MKRFVSEGTCSLSGKRGPVTHILVATPNGKVVNSNVATEIAALENLPERITLDEYKELLEEYNLENWPENG